ncbi:RICIN domain-containing protein [Glaciibacter psychrotolerans]|uniref:Fibronectin type-III domain-containing protein n=1 Tax=Glaciibacter psychrotolerans TaxID=670054 RepID=A0A7Z0J6X4_9MICO|nr:RICIN domain-containing protein [Leifsonia psychrotolerans]NYJ20646.1 hypothetical protein [Leifsonia psychrotolerans]
MTGSTKPTRMRSRLSVALGFTLFLTLAGTAGASAYWTAPAATLNASAGAGTIGISQSGFDALAVQYTVGTLSTTKPVTVTNTGAGTAPYSLTLAAPGGALATGIVVKIWSVARTNLCTTGATAPTTSYNWTTIPAQTGSLASGASVFFCVRTSITAAQQNTLAAQTVTGTSNAVTTLGNWTSSAPVATATQSVLDTQPPTVPGTPTFSGTTTTATTLTWAASTDNVGVVAYDVYRDGVLLVPASPSTTFTDTALTPSKAYSYTVRAKDAAGNASQVSTSASVTTIAAAPSPTLWYTISNPTSGYCFDGEGANSASGTRLITFGCHGGTNQQWKFLADGTIQARYASLSLRAAGTNAGASLTLVNSAAGPTSWAVNAATGFPGQFQIKQSTANMCIDVTGLGSVGYVVQQSCSATSSGQRFTMTAVN